MEEKKSRPKPLTEEQVKRILGSVDWEIYDVPQTDWNNLPTFIETRNTVSVLASGILNQDQTTSMYGIPNVVGAFDWLRTEEKPKPNEPYLNAYHFVITKESEGNFFFYGPFTEELPVSHWVYAKDFEEYLNRLTGQSKFSKRKIVIIDDKAHALNQVMYCLPKEIKADTEFYYFQSFKEFSDKGLTDIEAVFLDFFLDKDRKPGTEFVGKLVSRYFFGFSSMKETTAALASAARETRNWPQENIFAIQKLKNQLENDELRLTLSKVMQTG